jgi:hypothetical protein
MVPGDMAIYFPKYQGIKCYAMRSGALPLESRHATDRY